MTRITTSHVARVAALAALALPLTAQATLQGLGTSVANLTVRDISSDGSAIVATTSSGIYLWTTSNPTFTLVSTVTGDCDVSNGGTYISCTRPDPSNANASTAARLDVATGVWTFLGGLGAQSGTSVSSCADISADGQYVVGLGWLSANRAHAYRWDSAGGMLDLGVISGVTSNSRADGISADGSTITGYDSDPSTGVWRAAKWVNLTETLVGCLDPMDPINGPSQGYAVSADGSFVVGESSTGLYTPSNWNEEHAWRWDAINGQIDIGTTPVDPFGWGTHHTVPVGVSADGRTIVGWAGVVAFGPGVVIPQFIWREGSGMSLLQDYLVALGTPQAGSWTFDKIAGISADGRVIAGWGHNPSNVIEPWLVVLPPLSETYCVAKVNSLGCTPAIDASGMASATSNQPFIVGASNVLNNKTGLVYYGYAALNAPFQGGTKCVATPTVRTPTQSSGGSISGNDCSGTYSYDFNALIQSAVNPQLTVGTKIYAQYWSRDPISPSTTGLTNAVSFTIFP
jgi:probable HAF family extracellular repeat protein